MAMLPIAPAIGTAEGAGRSGGSKPAGPVGPKVAYVHESRRASRNVHCQKQDRRTSHAKGKFAK